MKTLEALSEALPYIHMAFKGEAMMIVACKETGTILKYLRGSRIDARYKDRQQINHSDDNIQNAFRGQKADIIVPKEVYGVAFNAFSFPVMENDAEKSNGVTGLIKNISRQTNLLGLNASIEAARRTARCWF